MKQTTQREIQSNVEKQKEICLETGKQDAMRRRMGAPDIRCEQ